MPRDKKDNELNDELNTRRMNKFRQRLSEVRQVVEFIIEHAGHVGCATGDFVRNASRGDWELEVEKRSQTNGMCVSFTEQRLDFLKKLGKVPEGLALTLAIGELFPDQHVDLSSIPQTQSDEDPETAMLRAKAQLAQAISNSYGENRDLLIQALGLEDIMEAEDEDESEV
jgi:hypothetical protein